MLASHAEKARTKTGRAERLVETRLIVHRDKAMNKDNIMPSRHRRAERRCVR